MNSDAMIAGMPPAPAAGWFVGLDVGQSQDYTALCVMRRHYEDTGHFDRARFEKVYQRRLDVRLLERLPLNVTYPELVERVRQVVISPSLAGVTLVVDATGVGAPVVDMLRRSCGRVPLVAVTISGGDEVRQSSHSGRYSVPKRDLVHGLAASLQSGELRIAEGLPMAAELLRECMNFRVKVSAAGHDSYGTWREGEHDDLVLAVALAAWRATRPRIGHQQRRLV